MDNLFISNNVINTIVNEVISENKNLFLNKNYLKFKNYGIKNIEVTNNNVIVNLELDSSYANDILKVVATLQKDIKQMIEHITNYKVKDINIELIAMKNKN
ncbi:MAG: hypothetical protein LBR40_05645 [Bacilli bacterium]|jgi:uncharacterized alkaline shock family protein YloU|nr:hypothetical protein [Bacilli bacterium]